MALECLFGLMGFVCGIAWMYFSVIFMLAKRYKIRLTTASRILAEITAREKTEEQAKKI